VTDRIISKELSVEWCPTGKMIADYMTKPVQGTLFKQFRDYIMGVNKSSLNNVMIPPVLGSQECVGDFSDDFGND
jgi:hypothetical protein